MNLDVTFKVPKQIERGLINGTLERKGGVIREAGSKKIVAWLRESMTSDSALSNSSILSSTTTALTNLSNVASILNFSVSTMGFIIVLKRLGVIEQQLKQAEEILKTIDYKIDLSFYANFRAAIDLAINAFTMTNSETRKISAMQAINRLLEAEHHYTKLADLEISNSSQVADEYLSTLCLAYVTEARCYLELDELDTTRRRLKEGATVLRPRFEKHLNALLTTNPAAYLHPSLSEEISLSRLTKIYQWIKPELDECDVFEMQRGNLFNLAQNTKEWITTLPQAVCVPKGSTQTNVFNEIAKQSKKFIGSLPSISKSSGPKTDSDKIVQQSPEMEVLNNLPTVMGVMEQMVENENRLAMYESEVEMIHQLGMSFQEWRQLAPSSPAQGNDAELIYITVE